MKSYRVKKTASAFLLLGSITCGLLSSCAMSEQEAGRRGGIAGAVVGATGGFLAAKNNGASKSESIVSGIFGGAAGSELGKAAGKRSSTLKGLHDVKKGN